MINEFWVTRNKIHTQYVYFWPIDPKPYFTGNIYSTGRHWLRGLTFFKRMQYESFFYLSYIKLNEGEIKKIRITWEKIE